jgi:aryl-alcohol dehydrogenase-like predicted oxidoreductase
MLPTSPLGTTGMDVTRIGYGVWSVRHASDDAAIRGIHRAVEQGVNWLDTAAVYEFGSAERVIAAALRGLPEADRPYVFTKIGLVWDEDHPSRVPDRIGAPDSVRRQVEGCLHRLGTERLDLVQMQWPARDGTPVAETWAELERLKKEGKVRAAGLANHSVAQLSWTGTQVDVVELPVSLANRSATEQQIPWAAARGIGALAYQTLEAGLLTGKFTISRAEAMAPEDWRTQDPQFTTYLRRNLALVAALKPLAQRRGIPFATLATAWVLAVPGVAAAVVGARRPDQVHHTERSGCTDYELAAATTALEPAELAEIADTIRRIESRPSTVDGPRPVPGPATVEA